MGHGVNRMVFTTPDLRLKPQADRGSLLKQARCLLALSRLEPTLYISVRT
jgi:hypothetical protein